MALDVEKYKEKLINERDELTGDVGTVADVVQAIPADSDNDMIEVAQHGPVVDVESSIVDRKSNRLEKINAALDSIDDGTYGTCAKCGKPYRPAKARRRACGPLVHRDASAEEANFVTPTL